MSHYTRTAALVGLLVIGLPGLAAAQSPPLWGTLTPGPHAVGFRSGWQLDYSRRYNITFDDKTAYAPGKAPRPILVNLWYPATAAGDARRMPHRDYLNVRSDDPLLARFSTKMAEYNRGVIAVEVMGKAAAELTDKEKRLLDEFLDTPTACVRDAAPTRGPFPLVIYHAGAGSSFEDNSVFCEFLASRGFVVLGSAFQKPDGSSLSTDGQEGSARDLEFLIAYARQLPGVDWNHVGLVGHSLGAQAALLFRSQPNSAVDAVVSLDTTQDYRGVKDPMWEYYLTTPVQTNRKNFTCPLLMVADAHAFFELADSLQHSRRYYLTLTEMGHNDYISQGRISRERLYQLHLGDPNQTAEARAEEKAGLERARVGYPAVCTYALRFLEAELKGDVAAQEYLAKQYRETKLGGDAPHVEYVPEGATGPDPYKEDSGLPPTPRQLRPFLREQGSAKTIAVLRRFRKDAPTAPVYHPNFELFLVSDLLDRGQVQDAVAFRDYYRESGLDCDKVFLELGKLSQGQGRRDRAADFYKRVLLLDPANREAADKLKDVTEGKKNGKEP
jgi:dienelactone hydrolase